jgi:hypothetical protein
MKDRRHDLYSLKNKIMKNCLECRENCGREDKNSAVTVVVTPIITKSTKTVIITCATSTTSCGIIVFYQNLTLKENQNNLS